MRVGRFVRLVHRTLVEQCSAARGDGLLLAVSGGGDSIALLHALAAANQAFDMGLRLHVAHLNHRTRGADSDADAAFVADAAARLGLPATIESADVPARTGPDGGGLERAGRQARYDFFVRLARTQNCRLVATGHHADDNAETILQRIIRGTGPRGLAGIPASRPIAPDATLDDGRPILLVRPLLPLRRRTIHRYLSAGGLAFRTDATNASVEPTRNWLRHELLPLLAGRANPGVVGALLRLGELSGWVNTFIEDTARRSLAALVVDRTDVELALNAAGLAGRGEILQAELIRQAIMSLGPGEVEIGLRHLKAVMKLAGAEQSGKTVNLPGGMVASARGGQLVLRRGAAPQEAAFPADGAEQVITVRIGGRTALPRGRRELLIEVMANRPGLLEEFKATRRPGDELIDLDRVRPPLVVRARRPGDRFWPLGATGTKKVGDFLSDHKVSRADRDAVLLLCDQLGPIWVMPLRIDDRVRISERSMNIARLRIVEPQRTDA